jgi:putative toxin-antitoxin system antitoxin component (TIGR02293 family)
MKKSKKYPEEPIIDLSIVSEPMAAYYTSQKSSSLFWKNIGITVNISNDMEALLLIKTGIKMSVLSKMMISFGLSLEEMASILHTTDRTLRRYSSDSTLNIEQSERLIELAKLYFYGAEVFDTLEKFILWVNSPIRSINFKKPKDYLDTSIGIRLVTQLLGRIEHGIYS